MHDTATLTGEAFFRCYGDPIATELDGVRDKDGRYEHGPLHVLDVGSLDVNGTLRRFAPRRCQYIGVDQARGQGVDLVLEDPHVLPFVDGSFELIVSTSCLEHDPMFWLTFAEMARVVAKGGFIYISAPANGPYHGHPGDCWRFYADAPKALADWATRCGHPLELAEAFMMPPLSDVWIDCVAVFGKPPVPKRERIIHQFRHLLGGP